MNQYIELTIQYFETFKNKDYDKMASFLKDHTQYHNWTQTYVGIDKIIETNKHTIDKCRCGYHKNKALDKTKNRNTIAEIKFHTPLDELCGDYVFLKKWLSYLY